MNTLLCSVVLIPMLVAYAHEENQRENDTFGLQSLVFILIHLFLCLFEMNGRHNPSADKYYNMHHTSGNPVDSFPYVRKSHYVDPLSFLTCIL